MVSAEIIDPHNLLGRIHRARAHELPLPMPRLPASDPDLSCHDSKIHAILSSVAEGSNVDSPSAHAGGVVATRQITGAV